MRGRSEAVLEFFDEQRQASQLIVRLDEPAHPSTRLAERATIRGWFVVTNSADLASSLGQPKVTLLLEELINDKHPLRKHAGLACHEVSREPSTETAFIEELKVVPLISADGRALSGYATKENDLVFELSGTLNIVALIPRDEQQQRSFKLTLSVEQDSSVGVSNSVLMTVLPRSRWAEARGGFLFPLNAVVCSDFLPIQGWAVKPDDSLSEVELFINDISVGLSQHGLWSPYIHAALPDPKDSTHAMFSGTLLREEIEGAVVSERRLSRPIRIGASARFKSGTVLELSLPEVQWLPNTQGEDFSVEGEIERVHLTSEGLLRVEGWLACRDIDSVELLIEGAFKSVRVFPSPPAGLRMRWHRRKDIELQYLSVVEDVPCGFQIELHPLILGRFAGQLRLIAVDRVLGRKTAIGPGELWKQMTRVSRARAVYGGVTQQLASSVLGAVSRVGVRKRFPVNVPNISPQSDPSGLPKRMVFATHNLATTEGAPRVLFRLIESVIKESERRCKLLVISASDGPMRAELESLGVGVEVVPELSMVGQNWERYCRGSRNVRELLRNYRADFIYANVIDSLWAVDAANRLHMPVSWTIHESVNPLTWYGEIDPRIKLQFLERLRRATAWVFVAEATKELFAEFIDDSRTYVVPNGIALEGIEQALKKITKLEARRKLEIDNKAMVISIVGTTTARKGQDVFVREMGLVSKLYPKRELKFLIVGARKGEYLEELKRLAVEHEIEHQLEFVAETPQVENYYRAADIQVVASREESSPLVSLEAFAYGVPLVSTTVFGLAEQIEDGHNALAFDTEVQGSLAQQVKRLIDDSSLRKRLAGQGKRDVRNRFSLEKSMQAHLAVVKRVWGEVVGVGD